MQARRVALISAVSFLLVIILGLAPSGLPAHYISAQFEDEEGGEGEDVGEEDYIPPRAGNDGGDGEEDGVEEDYIPPLNPNRDSEDENVGGDQEPNRDSESQNNGPDPPSNCLIATAAFGSKLTTQVQFLRNFRDNYILSTMSGSSFINVFNAWYYSFSPYIADYERQQPWFQEIVKTSIYPLLAILQISEIMFTSIPGELGAIMAGLIASSLIGSTYLTPFALLTEKIRRRSKFNIAGCISAIAIAFASVVCSVHFRSEVALMITTSALILTTVTISSILSARVVVLITKKFNQVVRDQWLKNIRM